MQKIKIMFLPDTIDLGKPEKYVLSIRIRPNGFMFSISEPGNGRNYCLRETTFSPGENLLSNVKRIIFDFNFLTQEFKQTNVIFVSKDYELIPADFYDSKKAKELFKLTHTEKPEHIISALIEKQDAVLMYNVEKELFEFLSRNLWNPVFFHHSLIMIDYFEKKERLTLSSSKMYLYFHDDNLDIICFSGNKLIHNQTYVNEPVINQVYFILKLWEVCEFHQMKDYLLIAGKPDKSLIENLQEYIKNIEQINLPSEIHLWNEDALKAPLDLLTLSL